VVLEKNLLGQGWRFGGDGESGHDSRVEDALQRIARSGNQMRQGEPPDAVQLKSYLEQARADGYAQCLLLLPPRLGQRAEEVVQIVSQAGMAVTVCLAVDGVEPPVAPSKLRSLMFFRSPDSPCSTEDLSQAAQLWSRHGGEVMLVDRQAGVLLGDLRNYQRNLARRGKQSA
jgi:hypothetical protein